jgi:hypothetical protein
MSCSRLGLDWGYRAGSGSAPAIEQEAADAVEHWIQDSSASWLNCMGSVAAARRWVARLDGLHSYAGTIG